MAFYFCRTFIKNTTDQSGTISLTLGANETYKKRFIQRTSNLKKYIICT